MVPGEPELLKKARCDTCDTVSISTDEETNDEEDTLPDEIIDDDLSQNKDDSSRRCNWQCCGYCALISVAVLLWLGGGFYAMFFMTWPPSPVAQCGECHCSVSEGSQCPSWSPETDYSDYTIETLASQVAINPFTLACNPYEDDECETSPPQEMTELGEKAVCALHYEDLESGNAVGAQYRMKSYASDAQAEAAGGFITHYGACGVCSQTQDLAAYLRAVDLTSSGRRCSLQGLLSFDLGVDCYKDLGFTDTCAEMWIYNGYNTRDSCLWTCLADTFAANNGGGPQCQLNSCLQCDEEHSGPLFKHFAARTRRRSGMLSAIVRPCDALYQITHVAFPTVN